MKRLYTLKNKVTNQLVPNQYFERKEDAKPLRNKLNKELGSDQIVVTRGPDHRKGMS